MKFESDNPSGHTLIIDAGKELWRRRSWSQAKSINALRLGGMFWARRYLNS